MNKRQTAEKFARFLEQEIKEGPGRKPPMPEAQVDMHRRQLEQQLGHAGTADVIAFPERPDEPEDLIA